MFDDLNGKSRANRRRFLLRLHLRGEKRHLVLAQALWLGLAALTLTLFLFSLPLHFTQSREIFLPKHPGEGFLGYYILWQTVALHVVAMLTFALAAAIVFWRGPHGWMTTLVSVALLTSGASISPTMGAIVASGVSWRWLTTAIQAIGVGSLLFTFYLFPDGRFTPRWTRPLAFLWIGWLLAFIFLAPTAATPWKLPYLLQRLDFLFNSFFERWTELKNYLRYSGLFLVMSGWFASGIFAQIYRFKFVSTPLQRQQTKWVVFGLIAGVLGYFSFNGPLLMIRALQAPGPAHLFFYLIGEPISVGLMLLAPISITVSLLRRRLWDIDPIIQNTLVYGVVTGGLIAVYVGGVFAFQGIFRAIIDQRESDAAIVIATLVSASLFQPLRRRLQDFVDRRFYRERVDFRRAVMTFSREVRTIIDLPELLRVLVQRTTDLLHIVHGAVFLRNPDGSFYLAESHTPILSPECPPDCELNVPAPAEAAALDLSPSELGQLWGGRTVAPLKSRSYSLLVPLIAPRTGGVELVGVLALGARLSGQDYSFEDRTLLTGLADQAGTAIYVARLIQEKQAEARRREEAEHRLDAYRSSPAGRAGELAEEFIFHPETALIDLHRLTQEAAQNPATASMLANLPGAFNHLGIEPLARLAEGFNYIFASQIEAEMFPVGLRMLISQLENYPPEGLQLVCEWDAAGNYKTAPPRPAGLLRASDAFFLYQLARKAFEASCISHITELLPALKEAGARQSEPFGDLARALGWLHSAAEALHAYERVDASRDKLAYLVSAVERLGRVDYLARTELGGADRPVIQHIAEDWLTVVTGAMGDLQTRAQLTFHLLTRHTWQEDIVPIVLSIRNEGRGAALNVKVTLVPKPEYSVVDNVAQVGQIAPGDEVRVELRARPHMAEGADQFRARFIITYTDPRGPDQVENFADVVRLLAAEGAFQYIPNPYVVGTPLEAGSPLFFGREDVVAFIQENLAALHRNNLVLIGQRRTGKTSLLKQLPARLGDDYLPVYLDGQSLGLDPGMPNFFLSLATEIAFAMEDRGLSIGLPEYESFVESPAAFFQRNFLARVREAIGQRHLLIMFDEFEELETAVQRGNLDASIFSFLRHLIQHSENLSVIFCGTHRLEELASSYWNVLFNISLYRKIALLEKSEALRLIQEPVAPYDMRYDDLALDKIWQATAGHPYFLQLLCHSLVNRHNKTERSYVTVADVNAALDEILSSGEAHFVYLWTDARPEERLVLAAMSRMIPLTGHVTPVLIADYLAERGVTLERQVISDALHRLELRDILTSWNEADLAVDDVYRWRIGLLGLWVERYRSLSRVVQEAQSILSSAAPTIGET